MPAGALVLFNIAPSPTLEEGGGKMERERENHKSHENRNIFLLLFNIPGQVKRE